MSKPGKTPAFREWLVLACLAAACFTAWLKLGYPQFSPLDFTVGKEQAERTAEDLLRGRGVEPGRYIRSVVFDSEEWADTYLQKTMGLEREERFVREHACELFSWKVRFFRQFEKEEYLVGVSPQTGGVISFEHKIPDVEARPTPAREAAAERAAGFLRQSGIDLGGYEFNEETAKKFDNRTDYSFSWEKSGVYVPWKEGKGVARLITGATVSGDEITGFYFHRLDLPESFYRYIERQMYFGEYVSSFSQILFGVFIVFALAALVARRNAAAGRFIRGKMVLVAAFLALVNLLALANNLQNVLQNYSTSASLSSFIGIYFLQSIMGLFFLGVVFAAPALAGEALQPEQFPSLRKASLTHYSLSSFFTRGFSRSILLGYVIFIILLGLQASLFFLGQKYLGVWKQWIKLTQFSSAYVPFFSAFAVGVTASLTEEAIYRMFGIPWGKKVFKSAFIAVAFTSVAWGFGHTQYAIFPVWFRGIEVSAIGFLYGFLFLRYGVIPLIVAHYLFDVFWGVSPYILGRGSPALFAGSAVILALPLLFAALAFIKNRSEREREASFLLDPSQRFNLGVLRAFLERERASGAGEESLRAELLRNHWDPVIVELALKKEKAE